MQVYIINNLLFDCMRHSTILDSRRLSRRFVCMCDYKMRGFTLKAMSQSLSTAVRLLLFKGHVAPELVTDRNISLVPGLQWGHTHPIQNTVNKKQLFVWLF